LVPADEDLPVPVFFAGFESVPDEPESEPDVFASDPDFSLAAAESEESDEEEPFTLDPLTEAELRLSVR